MQGVRSRHNACFTTVPARLAGSPAKLQGRQPSCRIASQVFASLRVDHDVKDSAGLGLGGCKGAFRAPEAGRCCRSGTLHTKWRLAGGAGDQHIHCGRYGTAASSARLARLAQGGTVAWPAAQRSAAQRSAPSLCSIACTPAWWGAAWGMNVLLVQRAFVRSARLTALQATSPTWRLPSCPPVPCVLRLHNMQSRAMGAARW